MNEHETDLLLALLAEGRLSPADAEHARQMIAADPAMSETLSDLLGIQALGDGAALPTVSDAEASAALHHMQEVMHGGDGGASDASILHQGEAGHEGGTGTDAVGSVRNPGHRDTLLSGTENQNMYHQPDRHDMHDAINGVFGPGAQHLAPENIGTPAAPELFSDTVRQGQPDTCAIKCQEIVLNEYGVHVSADELAHEAASHGWYVPGAGMSEADVGKLLEAHGVQIQRYEDANVFNLVSELAQGHRVIIGVDSGEMWSSNEVLKDVSSIRPEFYEDGVADHAVIVSGVDISDPNHPMVVITDPGTGQVAATYPLDTFLDAWADSGFSMVATTESPDQFALAHVDAIGHLPYETFAQWYPTVSGLDGHEYWFGDACASFRHCVHSPVADALGSLFQPDIERHAGGMIDITGDHLAGGLGHDHHILRPDHHDTTGLEHDGHHPA